MGQLQPSRYSAPTLPLLSSNLPPVSRELVLLPRSTQSQRAALHLLSRGAASPGAAEARGLGRVLYPPAPPTDQQDAPEMPKHSQSFAPRDRLLLLSSAASPAEEL